MLTIWEIVNAKIISNKIHTPVRKFINPFLFVIYEIVKNSNVIIYIVLFKSAI